MQPALLAEYINNSNPLIIANSDQYIEWDSSEHFMGTSKKFDVNFTFKSIHQMVCQMCQKFKNC